MATVYQDLSQLGAPIRHYSDQASLRLEESVSAPKARKTIWTQLYRSSQLIKDEPALESPKNPLTRIYSGSLLLRSRRTHAQIAADALGQSDLLHLLDEDLSSQFQQYKQVFAISYYIAIYSFYLFLVFHVPIAWGFELAEQFVAFIMIILIELIVNLIKQRVEDSKLSIRQLLLSRKYNLINLLIVAALFVELYFSYFMSLMVFFLLTQYKLKTLQLSIIEELRIINQSSKNLLQTAYFVIKIASAVNLLVCFWAQYIEFNDYNICLAKVVLHLLFNSQTNYQQQEEILAIFSILSLLFWISVYKDFFHESNAACTRTHIDKLSVASLLHKKLPHFRYATLCQVLVRSDILALDNAPIFNSSYNSQDTSYYIILRGTVHLSLPTGQIVKRLQKSEGFGEIAFYTGQGRRLEATAIGQCLLLRIPREVFLSQLTYSEKEIFQQFSENICLKASMPAQCYICHSSLHYIDCCPHMHYLPKLSSCLNRFHSVNHRNSDYERKKKGKLNAWALLRRKSNVTYDVSSQSKSDESEQQRFLENMKTFSDKRVSSNITTIRSDEEDCNFRSQRSIQWQPTKQKYLGTIPEIDMENEQFHEEKSLEIVSEKLFRNEGRNRELIRQKWLNQRSHSEFLSSHDNHHQKFIDLDSYFQDKQSFNEFALSCDHCFHDGELLAKVQQNCRKTL